MTKLFLSTLIIFLLFACDTTEPGTTLSGSADNVEDAYFILSGMEGTKDTVFLNEDSTFQFEFKEIEKPSSYYISFKSGFVRLNIAPLQNVELYFDKNDIKKSAIFTGDGADINNYQVAKGNSENIKPGGPEVFSLAYSDFKEWADNNKTAQLELLNSTIKVNESNEFWVTEEANILYGWGSDLERYPNYHKYYAKVEDVELPDDYDSYKKELDINRPEYLGSRAYTDFVSGAVRSLVSEKMAELEDADRALLSLETAAEVISDKKVLDNFRVSSLKGQLSWTEISELAEAIDYLRANVSDEELMADFNKEHDDWLGLAAGEQGFNFVGVDIEGNEVYFSDFKGKYVYVDVWATWCGPCRAEIPYLKKLEEDYHDRNIVFVSYSIDDDKNAWLEFVPREELGGVQIFGENAWQGDMPKHYKVRGVPTFMLFGPEGEIITVKMTRPSDDNTRKKFDSYTDL